MKKVFFAFVAVAGLALASCNNAPKEETTVVTEETAPAATEEVAPAATEVVPVDTTVVTPAQ